MIRRPPRSTPLSLHDALPICGPGLFRTSCGTRTLPRSWRYAPRRSVLSRSEEHTSELQSLAYLVCRLLLEKKKKKNNKQLHKLPSTSPPVCHPLNLVTLVAVV